MNVEIGTEDAQFPEKEYKKEVGSDNPCVTLALGSVKGGADNAKPVLSCTVFRI